MRLFVAIFPPKEFLDYARDVVRGLDKEKRNIRQVSLDQMQITLRYIGSKVSDGSKNKIAAELRRKQGSFPSPEIKLESLHFGLPRQHHPKILFMEVEENSEYKELVNTLHREVRDLKLNDTIQWKEKNVMPHMSIARLKPAAVNNSTIRKVKSLIAELDVPYPPAFYPKEMHLVQSILTNTGPKYKKLESITL